MRSFSLLVLLVFFSVYFIFTFGASKSLTHVLHKKYKKPVIFCLWIESVILMTVFVFTYLWPNFAKSATNYTLPLIINGLLVLDFFFKIPMLIAFIVSLFFNKRRRVVISLMGLILASGVLITIITGNFSKNAIRVTKTEIQFENLPANFNGFKIAQFSDIHLGSFIFSKNVARKLQMEIIKADPDMILFTGDLVNNYVEETNNWEKTFKQITHKIPAYSILGNHDYGNYSTWPDSASKRTNFAGIIKAHNSFGFNLLRNEYTILRLENDSVFLIGVENWGHPPFPQYADFEKAINGIPEKGFKILMTHDPTHWQHLIQQKKDIALTLSGHTHGMQWGIKPAGITFSISYLVSKTWGGLYKKADNYLYVNTGTGQVGIPFRIDMPPELSILTLKGVKID